MENERAKIKFSIDSNTKGRIEFTEYVETSDGFVYDNGVTSHVLLFSRDGDVLWFDSNGIDVGENYRTSMSAFPSEFTGIIGMDRCHPIHQNS